MPRILLTGATGFLGTHLLNRLSASDEHSVRALVRDPGRLGRRAELVDEVWVGDLTQPGTIRGIADGVDAVIHTACAVAGTFDSSHSAVDRFLAVNRDGTTHLAQEALRAGNPRFVHVSSTAAMGPPADPIVDEDSPCRPRTPYQRSKYESERALLDLHAGQGLDLVILRPCVIAGEGKAHSEWETLFRLVRKGIFPLVGAEPALPKPIVMVDDVVSACIQATRTGVSGHRYLLTCGVHHTIGDMLRCAARIVGAPRPWVPVPTVFARAAATVFEAGQALAPTWNPPLTHDRIDMFTASRIVRIDRARNELGYDPHIQALDEMMSRTYTDLIERGVL